MFCATKHYIIVFVQLIKSHKNLDHLFFIRQYGVVSAVSSNRRFSWDEDLSLGSGVSVCIGIGGDTNPTCVGVFVNCSGAAPIPNSVRSMISLPAQ